MPNENSRPPGSRAGSPADETPGGIARCDCDPDPAAKSAQSTGGLFGWAALFRWFQRRPEPVSFLKPSLELAAGPRPRPAVRQEPRVEPFYGDEEYVPVPEEEPEAGLGDLLPFPDFLTEEAAAAAESGDPLDEEEDEEELGAGFAMVQIEPHRSSAGLHGHAARTPHGSAFTERSTVCFECGAPLHCDEQVTSTICKRCSACISFAPVSVRDHRREGVKTRGPLTIHAKASLSAPEIACETLRVYGKITGKIDCHGDAFFRSTGKVVGNFRCRHLFVHRSSDLTFVPGIRAERAEIHGRVVGDLICEGTIRISKTGMVLGDCIAPAIQLESGGVLTGQMKIASPDQQLRDDYDRKAEVARCEFMMRGIEEFEQSARGAA